MLRVLLVVLMGVTPATAQEFRLFTVGAGDVGGGYYAAAHTICERLNRAGPANMRCSPEATPGSFYNLAALRDGQLDFALVQSDWQRYAYEGSESFSERGALADLRSVMSLYPEALTVLARDDVGIDQLSDLLGKRVDIGHPASGRHATVMRLLELLGAQREDFAAVLELPTGAAVDELCAGRIDATILILGHPNESTRRALTTCGAVLLPLDEPKVMAALGTSSDYVPSVIPAGTYPGMTREVPTFAVIATLVTLVGTDPEEVSALVAETLKGLPELSITAPILANLSPEDMQVRGLTAPLHDGAKAAFAAKQ